MRLNKVVLTVTIFGVSACGRADKLVSDNGLVEKIRKEVTSGQKSMNVNKIADFEWDSLLILTPYSNAADIEDKFNIDLSVTKHSSIEHRDDINQLIFFNKGTPTKMIEYPRYPGDFADNKIEFIQRDSAVFDIVITAQKTVAGDNWIKLIKQ